MPSNHTFYTHTILADGLRELFKQLEQRLALQNPVNVYLAGGMAVHLYAANRLTTDVDAEFGGHIHLPNDLIVEITLEDGTPQVVYLDTNYNSMSALLNDNYLDNSVLVDLGLDHICVHVLSPVDLAVSKISRFANHDKEDIAALVRLGLTSADAIEERAHSALAGYVGGQAKLLYNLRDAVELAKRVKSETIGDCSDERSSFRV